MIEDLSNYKYVVARFEVLRFVAFNNEKLATIDGEEFEAKHP